PGEREIRECAQRLSRHGLRHTEILPLYARLSAAEQQRIFAPHMGRRIVLTTNVAETSLTVPGIHYVIDSGLARIARYSPRSRIQKLSVEAISQASANQRAGRCGRVAPGVCIRLFDEADFTGRPAFTDPEILRTNLASVVLRLIELRLGEPEHFPFIEPPDSRQLASARRLLFELGAPAHHPAGAPTRPPAGRPHPRAHGAFNLKCGQYHHRRCADRGGIFVDTRPA
ncbi:MAG: hypothetical protein B7X12_10215, partial [Halothiobacillus sp. 20-53-49]